MEIACVYIIVMMILCCIGFVVGYVIDEELAYGAFFGAWLGLIWPLTLIGIILIGIGRIILWIKNTN